MARIEVKLTESNDSYTHRWFSGEDVVFTGNFKHNRFSPFQVILFETHAEFAKWHGIEVGGAWKNRVNEGRGDLAARASVISSTPQPKRTRIEVAVGDVLVTELGEFEVCDDWGLHDPYLVAVA